MLCWSRHPAPKGSLPENHQLKNFRAYASVAAGCDLNVRREIPSDPKCVHQSWEVSWHQGEPNTIIDSCAALKHSVTGQTPQDETHSELSPNLTFTFLSPADHLAVFNFIPSRMPSLGDGSRIAWDRLRAKPLFAGSPHRDYTRRRVSLDYLLTTIFPLWDRNSADMEIYPRIHIPPSVLHEWRYDWEVDPTWRPWNGQIHGTHHRVFTGAEQAQLGQVIVGEWIAQGRQFIAPTFRGLAHDA